MSAMSMSFGAIRAGAAPKAAAKRVSMRCSKVQSGSVVFKPSALKVRTAARTVSIRASQNGGVPVGNGITVYVVPMEEESGSAASPPPADFSSTMGSLGVSSSAAPVPPALRGAMPPAPVAAPAADKPEHAKLGGGNAGPPHRVTDQVLQALIGDGCKAATNLELLFKKAVLAGIFIGLGGVLCSSVGGDCPGLIGDNPGLQRAVFGALGFPVSIFLVTTLGAAAFTGTIVMVAAALACARMSYEDAANVLGVAWIGNAVGLLSVAALAASGAMDAVAPCMDISIHKAAASWGECFARGIGGGILICCAIAQAYAAREGVSKILGIWFCISTYVMCGWEHGLANLFFFPCALFGDPTGPMSWGIFITKNLIPSTLGNLVGGAILGAILSAIHTPGTPLPCHGDQCEIEWDGDGEAPEGTKV